MEEKILQKIVESVNHGKIAALAVITEEIGSSPRKSGSMMAIFQDKSTFGTIGGGKIEYTVIEKAVQCMKTKENTTFEYQLTENGLGMVCGGKVKGYIKIFYPKSKLIIIGAGHIGEKLNQLAKIMDFYTVIIDERVAFANKERFEDADEIITQDVKVALKEIEVSTNDFVVIATHSHSSDKDALELVINKNPFYIGMIGSARKVRHVMNDLIKSGISEERLRKVYSPIGLDIASQYPEEIAFGILSEILLLKNNGSLNHRKNLKKVWD